MNKAVKTLLPFVGIFLTVTITLYVWEGFLKSRLLKPKATVPAAVKK